MTFSVSQTQLSYTTVLPYLRYLAPSDKQSPEDWSAIEAKQIIAGDIVFALEPIFSQFGSSARGIGVNDGDKFKISTMLLIHKMDAGYPMSLALTSDSYEMQFVETE